MAILFVAWQHQTQQDEGIQLTPPDTRPSLTIPCICGARACLASSNMTFVFLWEIKSAAGHAVPAGEHTQLCSADGRGCGANTGLLLAVLDPVGSEESSIGGERCYTAAADGRITWRRPVTQ
jgi:hypothetical protein